MTPGGLEEVRRGLAGEGEREATLGRRRAAFREELLLPPDRLGADRRELGVFADRLEERVARPWPGGQR